MEVIIINYIAQKEGVILETNIPATLKTGNTAQVRTFVSWDKIGRLLFDNYTDKIEVEDLNNLRNKTT